MVYCTVGSGAGRVLYYWYQSDLFVGGGHSESVSYTHLTLPTIA